MTSWDSFSYQDASFPHVVSGNPCQLSKLHTWFTQFESVSIIVGNPILKEKKKSAKFFLSITPIGNGNGEENTLGDLEKSLQKQESFTLDFEIDIIRQYSLNSQEQNVAFTPL